MGVVVLAAALAGIRQATLFLRAPQALRWRLETFGLYMPSLPGARPWWRINAVALRALLAQLPSYLRWLAEMVALRRGGAHAYWRVVSGREARDWEAWLAITENEGVDHPHHSRRAELPGTAGFQPATGAGRMPAVPGKAPDADAGSHE